MAIIQQCSSSVTEGDNVTFYCNATGNPAPNITWARENLSAIVSFSEKLVIEDIRRNESGSYFCYASNGFGTHNTSCNVDVQCKFYEEKGCRGMSNLLFLMCNVSHQEQGSGDVSNLCFVIVTIYSFKKDCPELFSFRFTLFFDTRGLTSFSRLIPDFHFLSFVKRK